MGFMVVGVLLLVLKLAAIGPMANWSWWIILAPFALAAAWWTFADASGLTSRQAAQRHDERTRRRREEQAENLGLRPNSKRRR